MTDTEFTQAIETHRQSLIAYALARGYATHADAEDIVQDVITSIWRRKMHQQFRGDSGVFTWLCECVRNRAINALRDRNVPGRKEDRAGYMDAQQDVQASADLVTRARELVATVADPIVQQALELWLDGCQWREIAIAVDATPETVRKWVRETLRELAKEEVFA